MLSIRAINRGPLVSVSELIVGDKLGTACKSALFEHITNVNFTVLSVMYSSPAISALDIPRMISANISCSQKPRSQSVRNTLRTAFVPIPRGWRRLYIDFDTTQKQRYYQHKDCAGNHDKRYSERNHEPSVPAASPRRPNRKAEYCQAGTLALSDISEKRVCGTPTRIPEIDMPKPT